MQQPMTFAGSDDFTNALTNVRQANERMGTQMAAGALGAVASLEAQRELMAGYKEYAKSRAGAGAMPDIGGAITSIGKLFAQPGEYPGSMGSYDWGSQDASGWGTDFDYDRTGSYALPSDFNPLG
jgi:hypothetical protein